MPHDELLVGMVSDPDRLSDLDVQGTYTPTLHATTTDPNLGSTGTANGSWWRSGHWVEGEVRFSFAGSGVSAGSGTLYFSVPFQPDTTLMGSSGTADAAHRCAFGKIRDGDTGANTNTVVGQFRTQSGTHYLWLSRNASNNSVSNSSPIPWAAGDFITVQFGYLLDPDLL